MYSTQWSRLDNAAKIFPPSTTKDDTKVFRFSCELREKVDPVVLQHALDLSLEHFPFYRSTIRRGFFWYYFAQSDLKSEVKEEYKTPCAPLYGVNRNNLLFEVTYYRARINLEIYHALSDGMGALQFLKTIVSYYLLEKHPDTIDAHIHSRSDDASGEQRSDDAFDKYYSKKKSSKILKLTVGQQLTQAYRVRGERFSESRLGVIEGHVSAASLLKKAHELNATISELLTALFICAFHGGMKVRDEEKPVSISIPVDLRKFFATPSVRNFFSVINVSHNFSTQGKTFEDVLARVKISLREQLAPEKIFERINQLSSFEHALPIKMVPLAVKVPFLKNAAWNAEKANSAAFSNLGRIIMPPEMVPYIRLFDLFTSTSRPQICICSFEDALVISITSPFVSSNIQRSFFRSLGSLGIDIEIVSNIENLGGRHALLP
ncbi:hypothetical protein AGMMS50268_20570 [Spirochaetia bacterium]|nr:hypothetical protein AGMMS50268_20570 [Spirochaetia bacterium]